MEHFLSDLRLLRRIKEFRRGSSTSKEFVLLIVVLALFLEGVSLSDLDGGGTPRPLLDCENEKTDRKPRVLTDLKMLYRQGCLAKLLCGVHVALPPSTSTSSLNDYAYMVKSVFENFSIKGVAKSLHAIKKAQQSRKQQATVPSEINKLEFIQDLESSEDGGSVEEIDEGSNEQYSMSLEDQLHNEFVNMKNKNNRSNLSKLEKYIYNRVTAMRNPRFDKTMYLSKKQEEFSMTSDDERKLSIAGEVGKKFRSARQCRAFGLLDRVINFTRCPFNSADLQKIILQSSKTQPPTVISVVPTTETSKLMHKTNKLRHLLDDYEDDETDFSSEEDANLERYDSQRNHNKHKTLFDAGEVQKILASLVNYGSGNEQWPPYETGSLTASYNTGKLTNSGGTTAAPYNLLFQKLTDYGSDIGINLKEQGKNKKKVKGGNTENVRNPNIFHNENHVNIISLSGYPKNKENESEEDGHGWPSKMEVEDHGWHKHHNYDTSESEEDEEDEMIKESDEKYEIELRNNSKRNPGLNVALNMNPVFTVTNTHGSNNGGDLRLPSVKLPPLFPNNVLPGVPPLPALPQLPQLPQLPMLLPQLPVMPVEEVDPNATGEEDGETENAENDFYEAYDN